MLWMIFENETSRRFRCDSDGRLQGAKWGALDSSDPLKLFQVSSPVGGFILPA